MTTEHKLIEIEQTLDKRIHKFHELFQKTDCKSLALARKLDSLYGKKALCLNYQRVIENLSFDIKRTKDFIKSFPGYLLEEDSF